MNSEKIIIEIKCAGINRSFDCIVPRTITGSALCRSYLELVEEITHVQFGSYEDVMLISGKTGSPIAPDLTLDLAGVDSGDTLYVI